MDIYRLTNECSSLPLCLFDNTEYECRTHDEWVDPEISGELDATLKGTPAMAARFAEDGECYWVPARVAACHCYTDNTYKVYYEDDVNQPLILERWGLLSFHKT